MMILNQQFAQKFVDSIMGNIGYNVNIMNKNGIIIASGSKERIGSFHKVALEVIKCQKRIDVDDKFSDEVQVGINMPFYFDDKIAGVIGITGEPNILENIASMVKMMVEIMMEQEYLKERIYLNQNQNAFLVNKLISETTEDNSSEICEWCKKLGYNFESPRCVCLIAVKIPPKNKKPLICIANIKNAILSEMKALKSYDPQDIISENDINKIVILKMIETTNEFIPTKLKNYLDDVMELIHTKHGLELNICVGSTYSDPIKNLRTSYAEAQVMLDLAIKSSLQSDIYFVSEHIPEYLFYQIPQGKLHHFLGQYSEQLKENTELKETIKGLVANDMNIINTSKQLNMHRNTVVFRLEKLKNMLHINPLHKIEDRMLLEIIDLYLIFYDVT
jgi:carbohydrate diacid regulator